MYWREHSNTPVRGIGLSDVGGVEERAGVKSGKGKVQGNLISAYKYLMGVVKKMKPDSSRQYPAKGQEAVDSN